LSCTPQISDTTQNYHDYKFVWSQTALLWFVDGMLTCSTTSPQFIPTTPMFVLIDLYLGKKDGGGPIDPTTFPQSNTIRYLRICPVGTNVCDDARLELIVKYRCVRSRRHGVQRADHNEKALGRGVERSANRKNSHATFLELRANRFGLEWRLGACFALCRVVSGCDLVSLP
jgi:hypothetical protein